MPRRPRQWASGYDDSEYGEPTWTFILAKAWCWWRTDCACFLDACRFRRAWHDALASSLAGSVQVSLDAKPPKPAALKLLRELCPLALQKCVV